MKRMLTSLLVLTLLLGQAPAWAMACGQRCMPSASLACLRVCAKSKDLLTQHGKLPSLGQGCGQVETRFAQPSLAAVVLPSLTLPQSTFSAPVALTASLAASIAFLQYAHAPPLAKPAQTILSVPVAQAPPVSLLSV